MISFNNVSEKSPDETLVIAALGGFTDWVERLGKSEVIFSLEQKQKAQELAMVGAFFDTAHAIASLPILQ